MQPLEKTTRESRRFDIDCSLDLDADETITSITSITDDSGELTFANSVVNTTAVTYKGPRTVAAGKVIQVLIGGGTIPAGAGQVTRYGRALFATNKEPAVEAVFALILRDKPGAFEGV